jgi:DNA-binding CsgD family transcriptional regulator
VDLVARVARLTAGQRECLDLVDDHATSKEIARQLGISRHTVDARLRGAIQTLGVTSRREAAIIYRTAMQAAPYQPLAYQPPRIVPPAPDADNRAHDLLEPSPATDDAAEAANPLAGVRIERGQPTPAYVADSAVWSQAAMPDLVVRQPPLRLWGGANDLSPTQRMVGILIVMILAMLAFGILLSGIEALTLLRS